jgi:hypothetical protein
LEKRGEAKVIQNKEGFLVVTARPTFDNNSHGHTLPPFLEEITRKWGMRKKKCLIYYIYSSLLDEVCMPHL